MLTYRSLFKSNGNNFVFDPFSEFSYETISVGNDVYIGPGACFQASESAINLGNKIMFGPNVTIMGGDHNTSELGVYMYDQKIKLPDNDLPVVIEDDVDIGAATTIDRATLGSTIIRKGVKLDNQIQIAHNVEIGKNTVIAAQTGIAGSTKIGENCQIGGQVGVAGHLTIGNGVRVQAQSGIGRNIKDNEVLQGSPSFGYSDWNKSYVYFKNLPKIVKTINNLEKKVNGDS